MWVCIEVFDKMGVHISCKEVLIMQRCMEENSKLCTVQNRDTVNPILCDLPREH
jgi:hypothetical protein